MKNKLNFGIIALALIALSSCSNDQVSTPQFKASTTITGETLSGSVKGTMESGKTYYFNSKVTINANDTLVMQSGVKLLATNPAAELIVKGVFISLGTKENPNWITGKDAYLNPANYKLTTLQDPNTDPALKPDGKLWGGIQCEATCSLLDIKWTHLDFAGGTADDLNADQGYKSGDDLFNIKFGNPDGILILEDSWVYGSTTDAVRANGGKIHIMRNTVEKVAYNDGDCFNVKNSSIGDMAYNLIIGTAKGGTKASNKGTYGSVQTEINMYNNTYVSGGFRSVDPDRGANANIEQGAKGKVYNNLFVNCRTGLRILENPAADFANCFYGNNLSYGDTAAIVNEFYPTTHATTPQPTDLPLPSSFLPVGYVNGAVYNAPQLVGQNNPKFVNFPLPVPVIANLTLYNFQGNYDFHLAADSPAIGKGNASFTAVNATASLTNQYLKATVTPPNVDLGAFPKNGLGNLHN
ncbi:hypothetical protein AB3G33_15265 [Flavobacterium sp. WC2421]|jgi:hypothetical protein|uniref:Right-handed parallel beta-helix repeat-containing protein n=1 Tax=Flavobacterium sp. WC2409 TaxID=3234139 RepID=A0AB39VX66_9FLAO